jgi:hypothetical protein
MPYFYGILTLLVIWLFYGLCSQKWNPLRLVIGEDGRASSSKFQFFLWTCMIIFGYVAIYSVKAMNGDSSAFSKIPPNLLILMGVSTVSVVGAKAITGVQATQGTVKTTQKPDSSKSDNGKKKLPVEKRNSSFNFIYLVCDDDGTPALDKIQMIAWTFISLIIYLILIIQQVNSKGPYQLPNVDDTLLILMGISQGAYLGKKLTNSTTPSLLKLDRNTAQVGEEVTLTGQNFGDGQGGGYVKLTDTENNNIYYASVVQDKWQDGSITIIVPSIPESRYNISVNVGGKETSPLTLNIGK